MTALGFQQSRLALAASLILTACGGTNANQPTKAAIGDAKAGALWIGRSGCGSCHIIPGIMHANGLVGPPLIHFSKRTIVAGYLPNTPANLVNWLQHPQQIAPGNAMPEAGLTNKQARDIAAYLQGLD